MEKEQIPGLKTDVSLLLVKKDAELERALIEKLKLGEESVLKLRTMLKYNMWTIVQFAALSGLAVSTINNLTRPYVDRHTGMLTTGLDYCFPFENFATMGFKMIIRNEKSLKILK